MKTSIDIIYKRAVGPICLPYLLQDCVYSTVEVPGWGSQVYGGPETSNLRTVTLNVQATNYCLKNYTDVFGSQICTYTPGKDACQFDSGGPLIYRDKTTTKQYSAGIVSYGKFCASNAPSLNTRTSSFIPWIEQKTGATFCKK